MKELSLEDRPREKLLRLGAAALGDNELVALVLGSGCPQASALAMANTLLRVHGGLHALARGAIGDLSRAPGVGAAKAARLLAAIELGRRTLRHAPGARVQILSAREAAAYLLPTYGARAQEQFGVVLLDTKHRVLRTTVIAVGTLNSTVVEPRDVFREAMLAGAAAVLVFHNHPSGDPTPSPDDVALTARLVAAGTLMGIDVLDHVVLGDVRYCSLKELNKL